MKKFQVLCLLVSWAVHTHSKDFVGSSYPYSWNNDSNNNDDVIDIPRFIRLRNQTIV